MGFWSGHWRMQWGRMIPKIDLYRPNRSIFTYVKVSFFFGCFATFPFIALQIWRFMSPGLFDSEKKTLLPFLIRPHFVFAVEPPFIFWSCLCFQIFSKLSGNADQTVLPIMLEAKVGEYLDLIMVLIFCVWFVFPDTDYYGHIGTGR